jgi:hypothetical protein
VVVILSLADCRAVPPSEIGSTNMRRKMGRRICIRNNHRKAPRTAEN